MTRLLVSVVVAATLSAFGAPSIARAQVASPAASDTEAVAMRFVEVMNEVFAGGDSNLLDEVVAADYLDRTPSETRTGGTAAPDLAGLIASFEAVHAVFPDATVTVDDAIVEADMAALLVTFDGLRGPDTVVDGVIIVRVADGMVVESWNYERGGEAPLQPMFEATPAA